MVFDSTRFITSSLLSLSPDGHPATICLPVCRRYTYKRCVQPRIPDAEEGISFFFFSPSLLLFPLLFPRVEIRDWCLTYSRIPGKKQFRGGGNSNSREGGIKSRYVFERREFEKGNCGKVVGRVVEGLKT